MVSKEHQSDESIIPYMSIINFCMYVHMLIISTNKTANNCNSCDMHGVFHSLLEAYKVQQRNNKYHTCSYKLYGTYRTR